jgi:two-component system chemotaxis sensor kinase CheA
MDSDINIDMSQFHEVFFEECAEGIEIMEAGLLNLTDQSDPEVINTIFRAAHSIKGGGGTFGFGEISDFTHGLETILDEMRNARLGVNSEVVQLLLTSVDCLREMVQCCKSGDPQNEEIISDLKIKMAECAQTAGQNVPEQAAAIPDNETGIASIASWYISFNPHENLFYTGNDPFRLIKELHTLGDLKININCERLPDFSEMDAQDCYLGWEMELKGNILEEQIDEVFAWVEGYCELDIRSSENRRASEEYDRREQERREEQPKDGRRKGDKSVSVGQESTSIRVGIDKVDGLVNLVGELVITQSILSQVCIDLGVDQMEKLSDSLDQLERNTRDLQEQTMSIRMLPIDFAFQRLPRMVHDLSRTLGKKIDLKFSGESTELDKTVLEKIGDPLMHLVRNALDHGIELPGERIKAGKSETGLISISAYHQGGNIIIEILDDGAGLNTEKILNKAIERGVVAPGEELTDVQIQHLVFSAGFSTADVVTDVSGRGVGMDVVKRNMADLGGMVDVTSQSGKGSKFTIRLPLTVAILEGQMVRVSDQIYILPLLSIVESVQINSEQINVVAGESELYHYRDEYIPVVRLHELFGIQRQENDESRLLVVIDVGGSRIGLLVNDVVGQQQVVIKSLKKNFRDIPGVAGATVLGDGSIALIIDAQGIVQNYQASAASRAGAQH